MSKSAAIGILHGREETFPAAVLQEINGREDSPGAESILLGGVFPSAERKYRVILDRISHRITFYRAFVRQQEGLGAISLPADEAGKWRDVLLRTLQIMAIS